MKIFSGTKKSILAVSFLLNMFVFNAVVALPPEEKDALRANNNNNNNNNNNEEYHQNSEKDFSGNNRHDDINRIRRFLKAQGGGGGGGWEDESVSSSSVIVPEAVTCGTNVGKVNLNAYIATTVDEMGFEIIQRYSNGGFDNIWDSPSSSIKKAQYGLEGGKQYSISNNALDWDCACIIFLFYDTTDNKGYLGEEDYASVIFKNEIAFDTQGKTVYCSDFAYCGKIDDTTIIGYTEEKYFTFDARGVWAASRGCRQ